VSFVIESFLYLGPQDTFLNIGSGLLNVVLQAAYTTGAKCIGVEVDKDRFRQGELIYREMKELLVELADSSSGASSSSSSASSPLMQHEHNPENNIDLISGCEDNDECTPTSDTLTLGRRRGPLLEHYCGDITEKRIGSASDGGGSSRKTAEEDGYEVTHRFGGLLKEANIIYMNNYDGTFGTRENAGAQGDKQRSEERAETGV
jgi:hypothetical protein